MGKSTLQKKKKKRRVGPETRDRHKLYEMSVQSPDVNIEFFNKVYKKKNGHLPKLLKEDFCGTAIMSAEWVRQRDETEAIGVDLDLPTLEWAKKNNVEPLEEKASRVKLIHADVRSIQEPKVDVVAALNFSYFIFKEPEALRKYFRSVRDSLSPGGIFVLDIFGGWEAQQEVTDKTRYKGFTYVWEQKRFNPINNNGLFYIHFKFHGGGGIPKAFKYDWRLWTVPEVREALLASGFDTTDVYWEGIDEETNEGDGDFRKVNHAENCPGWNAFITAS